MNLTELSNKVMTLIELLRVFAIFLDRFCLCCIGNRFGISVSLRIYVFLLTFWNSTRYLLGFQFAFLGGGGFVCLCFEVRSWGTKWFCRILPFVCALVARTGSVCQSPLIAYIQIFLLFTLSYQVISVTAIYGGAGLNVIPSVVKMKGTMRAFTLDTVTRLRRRLEEVHLLLHFCFRYVMFKKLLIFYNGWKTIVKAKFNHVTLLLRVRSLTLTFTSQPLYLMLCNSNPRFD